MILLNDQITEHFRLSEFANNNDGGAMLLNPDVILFIQMLEEFRTWYNRPMPISSGYRTKAYNKKIGGASNSYHPKALAADFLLPAAYFNYSKARKQQFLDNIKAKWYEICKKHGKTGSVIYYDTWVHMSWWPTWYFEDKRGK